MRYAVRGRGALWLSDFEIVTAGDHTNAWADWTSDLTRAVMFKSQAEAVRVAAAVQAREVGPVSECPTRGAP